MKEHACEDDWFVVGNPVFEDMAVTFRVQCRVCHRIMWVRYDFVALYKDLQSMTDGLPVERV